MNVFQFAFFCEKCFLLYFFLRLLTPSRIVNLWVRRRAREFRAVLHSQRCLKFGSIPPHNFWLYFSAVTAWLRFHSPTALLILVHARMPVLTSGNTYVDQLEAFQNFVYMLISIAVFRNLVYLWWHLWSWGTQGQRPYEHICSIHLRFLHTASF